ncbi:MAG TPA: hypothetical protein VK613_14090 [Gaiellaceae bacterium]|nr:hypothetical protein [Gaiellaceae bacterium]
MNIYEFDISWATTAAERRYLHWMLVACDEVDGVFLTARDDVLAVLFSGKRARFDALARIWATDQLPPRTATTNRKGVLE